MFNPRTVPNLKQILKKDETIIEKLNTGNCRYNERSLFCHECGSPLIKTIDNCKYNTETGAKTIWYKFECSSSKCRNLGVFFIMIKIAGVILVIIGSIVLGILKIMGKL